MLATNRQFLNLSPDGAWVSVFDEVAGKVRITRSGSAATGSRGGLVTGAVDVWTAVAPGVLAVAWKHDAQTVAHALPGGEPVARVKSGSGFDLHLP